jgi:hypothetical protein
LLCYFLCFSGTHRVLERVISDLGRLPLSSGEWGIHKREAFSVAQSPRLEHLEHTLDGVGDLKRLGRSPVLTVDQRFVEVLIELEEMSLVVSLGRSEIRSGVDEDHFGECRSPLVEFHLVLLALLLIDVTHYELEVLLDVLESGLEVGPVAFHGEQQEVADDSFAHGLIFELLLGEGNAIHEQVAVEVLQEFLH